MFANVGWSDHYSLLRHSTTDWPIVNPLSRGSMACNNQATSCSHLNFRQVISSFTLLKRTIFAAIRPQFDDDLHSSRWRLQTDWKIAILISAEQHSAIISVHPVEICWDSVQWPRSLRHKNLYSRRWNFFCEDFRYVQ